MTAHVRANIAPPEGTETTRLVRLVAGWPKCCRFRAADRWAHGVQWATDMSRLWRLVVEDQQMGPVPSLLGAVVTKASALLNASDRDSGRRLSDIAFLADVATRNELMEALTARQASRVLEALVRIDRPGLEVLRLKIAMERVIRD